MNWRAVALVLLAWIVSMSTAGAQLLQGKTVSTIANHGSSPDKSTVFGPVESVVGPDIELIDFGFDGFLEIDYSDTNIRITASSDQPFGYWETVQVSDVTDSIADFTSVSINPETNWAGFSDARIIVSPDSITINLGSLKGLQGQIVSLDVNQVDSNLPPTVRVYASQQGRDVTTAAANAGPITVRADVRDPNSGDSHLFDWSSSDTGAFDPADAVDESYMLDPTAMNPGFYDIVVTVTDDGMPVESARGDMILHIVPEQPVLEASADSDGDGIHDLAEGYGGISKSMRGTVLPRPRTARVNVPRPAIRYLFKVSTPATRAYSCESRTAARTTAADLPTVRFAIPEASKSPSAWY